MKIHKHISTIFLLFFFINLSANDTVPFSSLVFQNTLERQSFNLKLNNHDAYLQMLSTVNSNVKIEDIKDIEVILQRIYKYLEQKKIRDKEPLKAALLVHHTLHKKLFKTFKTYTYFDEVFSNGNYNCATATAVLALTFDYFDIEYSIQEQRKHVFIIVKNEVNDIMVESTDERNGVYIMDKKEMLQQWSNLNLIQLSSTDLASYQSLFKVYTQQDLYRIDYKKLTANLYTNSAILMNRNERYEAAEHMMMKSLYLYNDREKKFRTAVNINHLMLKVDINKPETLLPILHLITHEQFSEVAKKELIGLFEYATKYLLLEQKDLKTHQALSLYISSHLDLNSNQKLLQRMDYINDYYAQYLVLAN